MGFEKFAIIYEEKNIPSLSLASPNMLLNTKMQHNKHSTPIRNMQAPLQMQHFYLPPVEKSFY